MADDLSAGERALTGVSMIDSPAAAVLASVRASGDPRVGGLPEGYLVPLYQP